MTIYDDLGVVMHDRLDALVDEMDELSISSRDQVLGAVQDWIDQTRALLPPRGKRG